MAQSIPLRTALTGQVDRIISIAQIGFAIAVLLTRDSIRSRRQHLMNHVPTPTKQTRLNLLLEVQTQRKCLTFFDQTTRCNHILRRHVIQRPNLIIVPPTSPIGKLFGGVVNILSRKLSHVSILGVHCLFIE